MNCPPLSVYMPVYNGERFVRDAVQSILQQSFSDFEFIIVDDGSTDRTSLILRDFAASDGRIRLISQPHLGVSAAANRAIMEARGEFLARIDGDDRALPQRLERQVSYLRDHPECVAVGSRMLLMDEDGLPLYVMPDTVYGHEQIDASLIRGGWSIAQGSCTYRRHALIAAGIYRADISLHEDLDLFLRLAERGKLENLPEVLQLYRRYAGTLSFGQDLASRKTMPDILRAARRRRGLEEPSGSNGEEVKPLPPVRHYRQWAWMTLRAGHVRTARRYARKCLRLTPLSFQSWKLMYCALRGR